MHKKDFYKTSKFSFVKVFFHFVLSFWAKFNIFRVFRLLCGIFRVEFNIFSSFPTFMWLFPSSVQHISLFLEFYVVFFDFRSTYFTLFPLLCSFSHLQFNIFHSFSNFMWSFLSYVQHISVFFHFYVAFPIFSSTHLALFTLLWGLFPFPFNIFSSFPTFIWLSPSPVQHISLFFNFYVVFSNLFSTHFALFRLLCGLFSFFIICRYFHIHNSHKHSQYFTKKKEKE